MTEILVNTTADQFKIEEVNYSLKEAKISIDKIAAFIDQIKLKYATNPKKTFLLGFSQGAILSYAVSLNSPNKVQHVIALMKKNNIQARQKIKRIIHYFKIRITFSNLSYLSN